MSAWKAGACASALALMLGCGPVVSRYRGEPSQDSGRKDMAEQEVLLEARVERAEAGLALVYEVRNPGGQAVWLLDRLYHTTPSGHLRLDADRVYVDLHDGQVVVSKRLVPVPEDMMVESPEVPAMTRLPPGGSVASRVVLPLPLREVQAYPRGEPRTLPLSEVRELRLRVGYLPDTPGLALSKGTDTEGVSFQMPHYGDAVQGQRVLDSGPLPLPSR